MAWIATGRGMSCERCEAYADLRGWRLRAALKTPLCTLCAYALIIAYATGERPILKA